MNNVIVLGGAGFVGSQIARRFLAQGDYVTVIDGMMEGTGAHMRNVPVGCELIAQPIEKVQGLKELLRKSQVVVDAMAWTSHLEALAQPLKDVHLNLESHIHLLTAMDEGANTRLIYLGSRGQYGKAVPSPINEDSPLLPDDVQGVNKTAADHYFRIFSTIKNLDVITLRFPNCYGPGQRIAGKDTGLIATFMRQALHGETIEIFGTDRYRNVVYVDDVADTVYHLSIEKLKNKYQAFNMAGERLRIAELVECILEVCQRGSYQVLPIPPEIQAIDMGDALVDETRLKAALGRIARTPLQEAMKKTKEYFESREEE